ncbi:2-C-methyl-D-erythritol 2,4-cyclodiphosphate synthase [Neisseria leonii]|uniref:2-C-methyl-D-erythritol 2,4-cyclodiphosphate synthase n=1 Tax=Neisseria leonii TaxID=2995413 RepID=A0A9X4IAN6_9NEIS|nr:2-C-methyl-D-erythritol 2,4-cyclodiphosphate synthase [Neisseria sp. 51.81]MDD9327580.1 2-C-methyl-D-erythritol 2,4-cyclodiphosphate synthase [Neisseria sp. 51.81]
MNIRIGQGYDVHQLVPGRPLILGGVTIPFDKGLLGHSDADALLHALTDALLGAAALGDIGKLFPDTASENKDADSRVLLRAAYQAVRRAGWQVVNVDSTVIAQQPKLRPHIDAMRANIAADLGLPVEAVNIKGKTNEKLGYLGRCEAIEAQAVVLLAADTDRLFQDQTVWKTA